MLCTVFKFFRSIFVVLLIFPLGACVSSSGTHSTVQTESAQKPGIQTENGTQTGLPAERTIGFKEVWTYILDGEEKVLHNKVRVSDIGYFGAYIDYRGKLAGVPNAQKLAFYPARVHLVVTCNHYGMSHIVLSPEYPLRAALIEDLLAAAGSKNYDGIQIDFEMVHASDKKNFIGFLQDLKTASDLKSTSDKNAKKLIISVAFPARTKKLKNDAYDYEAAAITDRFFVMAYDEHWSRSKPGPVASFDWCRKVAEYAVSCVPSEKLIMGQPFYGRTWGSVNANRAFYYSGIERQLKEFNITQIEENGGVFRFSYTLPLEVTGYFDNARSISARSRMYKEQGVHSTGFWCLGQEDPEVWEYIYVLNTD